MNFIGISSISQEKHRKGEKIPHSKQALNTFEMAGARIHDGSVLGRSETKVFIGNSNMTAFWADLWCGTHTMMEAFPPFFSHPKTESFIANSLFGWLVRIVAGS